MTLEACGPTYRDGVSSGYQTTLEHPVDVEKFVAYLAQPWVFPASIQTEVFACDVVVAHGYGYLYYAGIDQEVDGYSVGHPDSPAVEAEQWFPSGAGVSIETLTEALVELLETGRRPTNIQWQEYRSIHQDAG